MFTKKPFLFLFLLISVTFIFSLNLFYLSKNKKGQPSSSLPTPSQNILFFTSPINNLSAKVEKVEGDTIIVSKEFSYLPSSQGPEFMAPPPEGANPPTPFPTPYKQTLTFKVKTTPKTSFAREGFFTPLLFNLQPTPTMSFADIKAGDNINIFFQEDLRAVNDNQLTAARITLPSITNQIAGKIAKIEGDKIQIEATEMPPMPLPPEETSQPQKLFTFLIDDKTELSYQEKVKEKTPDQMMMEMLKPVKLTLSDLKVGDRVRVYSFQDILKTQNPKAVRIEPVRE